MFLEHTYWAKDIIFLITEYEFVGMQAWLGAYHADHSQCMYFFVDNSVLLYIFSIIEPFFKTYFIFIYSNGSFTQTV